MHIKLAYRDAVLQSAFDPAVKLPANIIADGSAILLDQKFAGYFQTFTGNPQINTCILTDPALKSPEPELEILHRMSAGRILTVHFYDISPAGISKDIMGAFRVRAVRTPGMAQIEMVNNLPVSELDLVVRSISSSVADLERSGQMKVVRSATTYWPQYGHLSAGNEAYNIHFDRQDRYDFDLRVVFSKKNGATVVFDNNDFTLGCEEGLDYRLPVIAFKKAAEPRALNGWCGPEGSVILMRPPSADKELFQVVLPSAHAPGIPDQTDKRRWTITHDLVLVR